MTEKELQKLKRVELLEILVEQGKEIERLKAELADKQKKLDDKKICLDRAGSIAEAAFLLNGVFDAAQSAAHQYLENIQRLSESQETVFQNMEEGTRKRCAEMERSCEEKCKSMESECERKCKEMLEQAQMGADKKWSDISSRMEAFYEAHKGLKEILTLVGVPTEDFFMDKE